MVNWQKLEDAGHDFTHVGMFVAGTHLYYCENCGGLLVVQQGEAELFHTHGGPKLVAEPCPGKAPEGRKTFKQKLAELIERTGSGFGSRLDERRQGSDGLRFGSTAMNEELLKLIETQLGAERVRFAPGRRWVAKEGTPLDWPPVVELVKYEPPSWGSKGAEVTFRTPEGQTHRIWASSFLMAYSEPPPRTRYDFILEEG